MKRPLTGLAIILCLGIVFASLIKISFLAIYVLALILLVLNLLLHKKGLSFDISLSCLVFLLGAALLRNTQILPKCHISKYLYYKNNNTYHLIRGLVYSEPLIKDNRTIFIFKTQEIQLNNLKYNCCGNILVYLKTKKDLCYADELFLNGNLYPPSNRKGQRGTSYRDYLYNQGIYSVLNVKTHSRVIKLNKNKGIMLKGFAICLKKKMEKIIFKHVSSLPAGILDAMILGERGNIPRFVNNTMIRSGTVHILVVSGFNVGIVAFLIILFLRLIRLPRNLSFLIAIPGLVIYCLMTGASTPVVRATVMSIVFMFGFLLKREPDIYNSCCVALIFILLINPRQLFDVGFQLSFASVLSIICLYPRMKLLLRTETIKVKYLRFIIEGCLVSFSAWLGTLGFIAYYFKIFSPITVLANIFIVPLASLITLCGASTIVVGLISPGIAPLFASTSELLVIMLLKINILLLKLPYAYFSL